MYEEIQNRDRPMIAEFWRFPDSVLELMSRPVKLDRSFKEGITNIMPRTTDQINEEMELHLRKKGYYSHLQVDELLKHAKRLEGRCEKLKASLNTVFQTLAFEIVKEEVRSEFIELKLVVEPNDDSNDDSPQSAGQPSS
jgi:hypothetical protein